MSDSNEATIALTALRHEVDRVIGIADPADRMRGVMFIAELARQAGKFQRRAWLGSPEKEAEGQAALSFEGDGGGDGDGDGGEDGEQRHFDAAAARRASEREPART